VVRFAVIASVAPRIAGQVGESLKLSGVEGIYTVSHRIYPAQIRYDDPSGVGVDRLCDAWGAYERAGGAAIAVDFGTATTINVVGDGGAFLGGIILPGPRLAAKALAGGTELLPEIEVTFPERLIGRSTIEAMAAGITYGWVEMIDGLIGRIENEAGRTLQVFATGGAGGAYAARSRRIEAYYPHLTLEGAAGIYLISREAV